MRHALEVDHLAAVATISSQTKSLSSAIRHGAVWGLGHTITLSIFGTAMIATEQLVSDRLAYYLEFTVGLMLIGLGLDLLYRLLKKRVHYHVHQHSDESRHFHAHSHQGEKLHESSSHEHAHGSAFPYRTLCVGLMHGMAGSVALTLLTLDVTESFGIGLIYLLLFGLGSIVGMAVLSVIIAIPIKASSKGLTWMHNGLQATIGLATVFVGILIVS